jgi:glycine oxidase
MVADVIVVGTGIIALSSAIELADRGLAVILVGTTHAGNASAAAGGMLAPSIGREPGPAHDFAAASRDLYPGWVAALTNRSGRPIALNSTGTLQVAITAEKASTLELSFESPSEWIAASDVAHLEPALGATCGAVLHPLDGSVEPLQLLDALSAAVALHERITIVREDCCEVRAHDTGCDVLTMMESRMAAQQVVLAAGVWTPLITGAGAAVAAVQPARGQMLAYQYDALRHVIAGADGYLIPRSDGTVAAGGTMEHAGFESVNTADGIASIRSRATMLCPALADAPLHSKWAGLRPVTPDLQPIIGKDPDRPQIIYACGHSRNGILLAPLTAVVVADIATGQAPRHDLSRFRPGRY